MRNKGFTIIEVLIALVLLSITSIVAINVLKNVGESSKSIASVSDENNKLRAAMNLIQRETAEANFIISADTTCTAKETPLPQCQTAPAAGGSQFTFVKKVDDTTGPTPGTPDGKDDYIAERFSYNNSNNTIVFQRSNVEASITAANANVAANERVILDKVYMKDGKQLFFYYKNATTPSDKTADGARFLNKIRLLEVNIRHDIDGPGKSEFEPTSLTTTVFLKNLDSGFADSVGATC